MALRVIRLIIPSGANAFRSVNLAQKVRVENAWKRKRIYPLNASMLQGHANFAS